MQTLESQNITKRFFEALQVLIQRKQIRGKKTLCNELNINRGTFYKVEKTLKSDAMQMSWIAHLITEYKVSAEWIMTGRGQMFTSKESQRLQTKIETSTTPLLEDKKGKNITE